MAASTRKTLHLVLDTNVLLTHLREVLHDCENNPSITFAIPWVVLDELDHLKGRHSSISMNSRIPVSFLARLAIRKLLETRRDAGQSDRLNAVLFNVADKLHSHRSHQLQRGHIDGTDEARPRPFRAEH